MAKIAKALCRIRHGSLDLKLVASDGTEFKTYAGITLTDLPNLGLRELSIDCLGDGLYQRYFADDDAYRQYYEVTSPPP